MEGSGWEGQNSALRVVEPHKEREMLRPFTQWWNRGGKTNFQV